MRKSAASEVPRLVPPAAPMPGAAPAASADLLVGLYATCVVSGIGTLHLFDWELRFRQNLIDVSGHGDEWEQYVPHRQGFTLRARGYMTRSGAANTTYYGGGALSATAPGAEQTVNCYSDFTQTLIFTGTCYAEDISFSAPNAMVEQEITLRGNAAPDIDGP